MPNDWFAITINAITSYPHSEVKELLPIKDDEPKINFDRSFYEKGKFFADQLPLVWVENIDTDKIISAVYENNNEEIELSRKFEEQAIYTFTNEHIERKNKKFKLKCDNITESKRYYKIVDFKKTSNNEIEILLPKRNSTGKIIDDSKAESYLKGIEPFLDNLIQYKNLQNFLDKIFKNNFTANNYTSNDKYDRKHFGNILINYISTKGKLSKQEFDKAVFSLLENSEKEDIQKRANYLRYSLQDAGFIDYDTQNSKIVINKPHLLIKPSDKGIITFLTGARDNNMINEIINYCQENNIFIEVQDNIDNLHPQIIYIKFKKPDINNVKTFAQQFNLIFKKDDLYTQFALASFFPDISEWEKFINKIENETSDFPGGLIFNIDNLAFVPKPENFNKRLSFIKYTNINGYMTVYRLWYKDVAYKIEEQQLGIYIYLYLFKKIAEDNYNECKKTRGWKNCGKEEELKVNSNKKTNVIIYDRNKKYLAVPLNCRLPRNLSISIALQNGQKPEIKYLDVQNIKKGVYIIYKNVPSLFLTNTINLHFLKKGLQSLNETAINIEL